MTVLKYNVFQCPSNARRYFWSITFGTSLCLQQKVGHGDVRQNVGYKRIQTDELIVKLSRYCRGESRIRQNHKYKTEVHFTRLCWKRIWGKNEVELFRQAESLAAVQPYKAIFWLPPGMTERTNSTGFSAEGTTSSAVTVLHCRKKMQLSTSNRIGCGPTVKTDHRDPSFKGAVTTRIFSPSCSASKQFCF